MASERRQMARTPCRPYSAARLRVSASIARSLAAENGRQGVRAICLRSDAIPETATIAEVYSLHADALGITSEQFQAFSSDMNQLKRLPTLAEAANVAAFMASDPSSDMTAAGVKPSCVVD